ncbi:hypothetical protein ACLBR5_17900 [Escherichia coli]
MPKLTHVPYDISHLVQDGCFLEEANIELTLQRLIDKEKPDITRTTRNWKNLVSATSGVLLDGRKST